MNSGAESVETALKAARRWGYRKKHIPPNEANIIVAKNNFHGRTLSIISFSSDPEYKSDFGPFTPGFIEIPFDDANALQQHITSNTCAFLVEPIQGEAGIIVPTPGWLKECEVICKKNNVLLIVDEIQSGLGRTGKRFAFEHDDVRPDGVIIGKALGGGFMPVSALVGTNELMNVFEPGSHGSTFGGNPLACRIGYEVLSLLENGDFIERSRLLGETLLNTLRAIQHPTIQAIRGKGLWAGVELDPNLAPAREVCEKLLQKGVLTKDVHNTVIRFAPPFIIDKSDLLQGIAHFEEVLNEDFRARVNRPTR